ncbi:hypothetical protein CLF_102200 [Clonorchis sinensis]|uniref:Trematode PH-like domain-containing protein n=1 Tax=Clonorchis sinensis TaxID=79923 RepID=G7Y7H3_CLOSI|nr:hypothetical protein CLF_102200 [Clonorchis sinensis]
MNNKYVEMNHYINQPVDKKYKQVVIRDVQIAPIGCTKLRIPEPYNEATANSILQEHMKKMKKHKFAPVLFLVDRIRFTKKSIHEVLNYREIQQFVGFQRYPNMFMLFVIEERNGKRSYESYACANLRDVLSVRDIMNTAQNDPKRLVAEVGSTRQLSITDSSSSSEYIIEARDSKTITTHPEFTQYIQRHPIQYFYMTEQEPQDVYQVYQPNVMTRASLGSAEMTDLKLHNSKEPYFTDQRPVYVYTPCVKKSHNTDDHSADWTHRTYY